MVVPLFVGRQKSIKALEEAMNKQKFILLAAQKEAKTNDPTEEDIYRVGTLGTVVQLLRLPDGTVKVLVEGKKRARVLRYLDEAEFFLVAAEEIEEVCEKTTEVEALIRSGQLDVRELRQAQQEDPARDDHVGRVDRRSGAARRHHRGAPGHQARGQADLARADQSGRAPREGARLHAVRDRDPRGRESASAPGSRSRWRRRRRSTTSTSRCGRSRRSSARRTSSRTRSRSSKEKIKQKKMSAEAKDKVEKELKKLKMMSPMSAEATVVRNYIDWISQPAVGRVHGRQARHQGGGEDPRRGSLRPRKGEAAHPRIPCGAEPGRPDEGPDPLPRRPSRASARPRSASRSRVRRAASSSACRSAACATRRRSAVIGGPTSARCPARSSSR